MPTEPTLEQAARELREALGEDLIHDLSQCDHPVNICGCGFRVALEDLDAALARHAETMEAVRELAGPATEALGCLFALQSEVKWIGTTPERLTAALARLRELGVIE